TSLPGFRDFFPAEMRLRTHILAGWHRVAGRYGFEEYDGPPLEPLELYVRKSGEEIVGQLYRFTDQGGREVALRPEMTPTFARMVGARAAGLPKPIRWYSTPQLFRYERPQKGRLREHFQLNMDIVGESGELADAEIIAAAIDVLREFGLGEADIVARVSDRKLMAAVLRQCGVPEDSLNGAFAVIDRLDKEDEAALRERLGKLGVAGAATDRILGLAGDSDLTLEAFVAGCGASAEIEAAADRLACVLDHLEAMGLGGFVRFDATLVRGLAYYTGTVFELWDRAGEFRAICGGGRYDGLLEAVGGPDLPALGFGMGDVVLAGLLTSRGLVPEGIPAVQDFVICETRDQRSLGLRVVHRLRDAGRRVVYDFADRSMARQLKVAHQLGAERAVLIGPAGGNEDVVRLRDLDSGDEERVSIEDLNPTND
ncbi:MAG: histidine--tRNA ligase, partial [Gemmatimonadota bacterium]|nr:histidine--tRNA ligase [Gemmatimonadota bacterium]